MQLEAASQDGKLVVVAVTYNSAETLTGLLDSLPAGLCGAGQARIVIVDNASVDCSVEIARSHPCGAETIETGRNGGYSAGINAAAAVAGPQDDMLILNPDIRLAPGSAAILRARLKRTGTGAVAPQILHEDGTIALSIRREPTLGTVWSEALLGGTLSTRLGTGEIVDIGPIYREGGAIDWATGAALMISAGARRMAGKWDESFFLYSEEVDYLRRVRQCGLTVDYVPEARAVHIGGDYQQNPFLCGLMARNRIRDYARRHGRAATALFRLGAIAGETIRLAAPAHRAALRAVMSPLPG